MCRAEEGKKGSTQVGKFRGDEGERINPVVWNRAGEEVRGRQGRRVVLASRLCCESLESPAAMSGEAR